MNRAPSWDSFTAGDEDDHQQTPLRFAFRGYSIWLELEGCHDDLIKATEMASFDLHVHKIPSPHVTVLYGMTHLDEDELRRRFRNNMSITSWPRLMPKGIHTDVIYDGVNGQDMDMAWIEITFATSPDHEDMVDSVHRAFFHDQSVRQFPSAPWTPHLSLVYENPEDAQLTIRYAIHLVQTFPTLLTSRRVQAIALWSTRGPMEEWKCLERQELKMVPNDEGPP